jgi:ABC-type lipoprotein export system ATPase subunit
MASIVDKPKESTQNDLLEIEKYTDGLIKFISTSATPITIGVQGEWGSGKTSLLNTIKEDLCDKSSSEHYSVWLNTWEYSLLSTPDETLIKIISGLVLQISELTKNYTTEKGKKAAGAIGSLLKTFGGGVGGIAGKAMQVTGDIIDSTVNKPQDNSIKALRIALQEVIDEAIANSNKKSFIFFIDDLDRLDPAVAVSILELIKNLFDLKNCIFVLAIDYGVVIKGLQSKFGVMTEENEWEFRAFFDKIIQLPFSMPISSYNIEKYLKSLLVDVNYFDKSDLVNEDIVSKISTIVRLSVGTNPRALKRLANSVSLIEIIRGDEKITTDERVIEFALICIQIAYPFIYSLIIKESNFTQWSDQLIYNVTKNKNIDEKDLEELKESEEFDEEWEQNIWRVCQVSSFLKQRAYQLSKLLNFIKDNMPENKDEEMGETLDRLLSMSSVTSVSAESIDTGKKAFQKIVYDDWVSYVESIRDKNISQKNIDEVRDIIDKIKEHTGKDCEIRYTPTLIALRSKIAKGRQKRFGAIRIKRKGIELELVDTDGTLRKVFPDGRIPDNKYLYLYITKDDLEEKFLPYIKEKFDELSRENTK